MDYQSAFLWKKGSTREYNKVSLILQQVNIHRKNVLFACVCESQQDGKEGVIESGYFTEALVEWFHKEILVLLERKATEKEVERRLQKEVVRVLEELKQHAAKNGCTEALSCRGLLLLENRFWLFSKATAQAWLINKRFNKKHIQLIGRMPDKAGIYWETGNIQKHLGLLLCTGDYLQHIRAEEVAEVLSPEGEISEERLQKRLYELWQENVLKGQEAAVGAIYIRT